MSAKKHFRVTVLALAALVSLSASAANYVEIKGTNVDFYYDTAVWGIGTASVLNDTLSFSVGVANPNSGVASVIATAHTGFKLSNEVKAGFTATTDGSGQFISTANVYDGKFDGKDFTTVPGSSPDGSGLLYWSQAQYFRKIIEPNPVPETFSTGAYIANNLVPGALLDTVGVSTESYVNYEYLATFHTFDKISYDFQVVSVVPEPATYAMLLAGLGLIGSIARRRKHS